MTQTQECITIARSDLGPALVLLHDRYDADYTPAQVEAALWRWLQAATHALVADADRYVARPHGFLMRAFDDALCQQ